MKKITCQLFFLCLLFNAYPQSNTASDIARLRALNARFINNFVTNDTASHSSIIHKDFVCITGNGTRLERQEYLDEWAHGFDGFKYFDYRDEDIKIFGTTALVRAKNKYIIKVGGQENTGMSMYTDIYIKVD